jgi:formylglycine-generating enzyme required for sulfatase activity
LGIQAVPGLTVTGTVGAIYQIQYLTDLTQTNSPGAWRSLEFLQLPASPYFWADASAPPAARRFYRAVEFSGGDSLVFIPPGTYRMGSPATETDRAPVEGPQTAVVIAHGFWMGKNLVTQGEFLDLMGSNPSFYGPNNGYPQDLTLPVENVMLSHGVRYCDALTQRERSAGRIATNSVYRLPTEAEWEYACRAWTSTRFSYGDDPGYTNLASYAWYTDNSGGVTHPVGQKLPNAWGLYDMQGNVWQWCSTWWSPALPGGVALDPQGPPSGTDTVLRGGSWRDPAAWCRSAYRDYHLTPNRYYPYIGFRVVLAAGDP